MIHSKRNVSVRILILCLIVFTTSACAFYNLVKNTDSQHSDSQQDEEAQVPLVISYFLWLDPYEGDSPAMVITFTESLEGVTVRCENPQTGDSQTFYEDDEFAASYTFVIGPGQGWRWTPGERLVVKADGYKKKIIQLPEEGTDEWEGLILQAQSNNYQAGSQTNSYTDQSDLFNDYPLTDPGTDSGITVTDEDRCQQAKEEYEYCMQKAAEQEDPVDQTLWLSTCSNAEELVNRLCY